MLCTTVRQILDGTEKKYGPEDAIRYKVGKNEIEAKSYTQLKEDSESFSNVLKNLGEQGKHISVIGATSYPWLVTYYTEDGGKNFKTLELPWEDIPEEVQYLSRVDSLTYEDGQYVLIMGQGLSGNQKVKFTSQSVESGWQFEEKGVEST